MVREGLANDQDHRTYTGTHSHGNDRLVCHLVPRTPSMNHKCTGPPRHAKGKKCAAQSSVAFIGPLNRGENRMETEDLDHSEVSSFRQVMMLSA